MNRWSHPRKVRAANPGCTADPWTNRRARGVNLGRRWRNDCGRVVCCPRGHRDSPWHSRFTFSAKFIRAPLLQANRTSTENAPAPRCPRELQLAITKKSTRRRPRLKVSNTEEGGKWLDASLAREKSTPEQGPASERARGWSLAHASTGASTTARKSGTGRGAGAGS